jgi:hypothetical protein
MYVQICARVPPATDTVWPRELRQFVNSCFAWDAKQRPTAVEVAAQLTALQSVLQRQLVPRGPALKKTAAMQLLLRPVKDTELLLLRQAGLVLLLHWWWTCRAAH